MPAQQLRSRPTASAKRNVDEPIHTLNVDEHKTVISSQSRIRFSILDVLRTLAGVFLVSSALSYFITNESIFWGYRPSFTHLSWLRARLRGPLLLTETELSAYNGTAPDLPLYLALNGTIYDVSVSPHIYGPGGSYHFFAGRDATRAFVTGCFEEDLTGDLRGAEEMFVPVELDEEPKMGNGLTAEENRKRRRDWKVRRERAYRDGRARVKETVERWRKTFDGGKGGKYFRVGQLRREDRWQGEKKMLCEKAIKARPKHMEDLAR